MDQDIENKVKTCHNCTDNKIPALKVEPCPEANKSWSRLHLEYAGPIKGFYYLVVIDSYMKLPEIYQCFYMINKIPERTLLKILNT